AAVQHERAGLQDVDRGRDVDVPAFAVRGGAEQVHLAVHRDRTDRGQGDVAARAATVDAGAGALALDQAVDDQVAAGGERGRSPDVQYRRVDAGPAGGVRLDAHAAGEDVAGGVDRDRAAVRAGAVDCAAREQRRRRLEGQAAGDDRHRPVDHVELPALLHGHV